MLQKIAIKMLGDFSVVADGRCVVDATAKLTKPWQLFCYLALNREHVTPSSVLLQELWGGEELADPANVLKNTVYALRRELALLDVLTLGKNQAVNLGVDYDKCVRRLLLGVTLYIAVATAMVGPISFLGLIIANLSRQLLRTYRHGQLILGSALFGMIVLVPFIRRVFPSSFGDSLLAMILPSAFSSP